MTPAARLWHALRSRRLAVSLICVLIVYVTVATLVPRGPSDDPELVAWAAAYPVAEAIVSPLGFHRAYVAPLFLALVGLLAICTAACAVERTKRALKLARATQALSEEAVERLRERPQLVVDVAADVDPQEALTAASAGLRRLGLRAQHGDGLVDGLSGRLGLVGSPLFHWSIVALMFVVAVGQATRAEGFLALPLGRGVIDEKASYLQVSEGPLFGGRYTGLEFVATSLPRSFVADGIDRGATPYITVYRSGTAVAGGYVYANNPMRVGSLMVHMAEFGPDVSLSLESTGGAEIARESFQVERSMETTSGTEPQEFTLSTGQAAPVSLRVQVVVRRGSSTDTSSPEVSKAILEASTTGTGQYDAPRVLAVGEAIELPNGQRLRVVGVTDWVRVTVANDWSVPYVYALLVIAIGALAIALLIPTRRATVLLVEQDGAWHLHVSTWHSSREPSFSDRVASAVNDAASTKEGT